MSGTTGTRAEALLVSPHAEDHEVIERIFKQQNWRLFRSATVKEALDSLEINPVPLVISERDLLTDGWKELLFEIQDLPFAPLLVVMSNQADEFLWSEVLNLCGHDVLPKPLYPPEALRVFRHAFQRWHGQGERKREVARD